MPEVVQKLKPYTRLHYLISINRQSKVLNNNLPVIVAKRTANAATPVALARVLFILSLFNTILVYLLINKKNNRKFKLGLQRPLTYVKINM